MLGKLTMLAAVWTGVLTGYIDLNVREVQTPAALLLGAGYVLGALHPAGAWRRALALGLSIPAAHLVARVTGTTLPYAMDSFASTFLALVPAFVGSYLGVVMRHLLRPANDERPAP